MPANASVSGLVSGLDTTSIINQLMQLEAQPQTLLKEKVSDKQRQVTSLQTINSKLANIATKAADLAKLSSWSPTKATSSNENVSVVADAGAVPSTLSFTVDALATHAVTTYTTAATQSDTTAMPANLDLTISFGDGRDPVTVNTGDGSLGDITAALNASGTGLDAALVRVGSNGTEPTYALTVRSEDTGSTSGFTIATADSSPFLGGVATQTAGTDASITIDGQTAPLVSASNTITDLMPGVDVTLKPGATGTTTVSVSRDATAMSDSVKALVEAVNSALADIDSLTASDPANNDVGILSGNSTLRSVRDQLLSSVTGGINGTSLADYGIQTDRDGKLVFDGAKFQSAYNADPDAVAAAFTSTSEDAGYAGIATTIAAIADTASNSTDGTITSSIKSRNSAIDDMNDAIAGWDTRLDTRRAALERQYAQLEVALGKLQSQSQWLAGQIANLPQIQTGSGD